MRLRPQLIHVRKGDTVTCNREETDLTTGCVDLPCDSLSAGEPTDPRRRKVDYRDPLHIFSRGALWSMMINAAINYQFARSCKKSNRAHKALWTHFACENRPRLSRSRLRRHERRASGDVAQLRNEDAGAGHFERDRQDRDEEFCSQSCAG